jgi:hypothetical protein
MPDDNDNQHIVLNFQPGPKSRQETGRKRPTNLKTNTNPEDAIASGAIVIALIFAVAIVSGWVPVGRYTIGIVACFAALAAAAKFVKARRSKASVTNLPRQRK